MSLKGNHKKVFNSDETAMFAEQTALLLGGGIALNEGMFMLKEDMEDAATVQVLERICESLDRNESFYEALNTAGAFPEYMLHMVYVGEKTGRLEEVMHSLSAYYERESRIKASLKSAVAYPLILFAVMTVILVVVAWKVLPMFERMFDELNSEVAAATRNVLRAGLTAGRVIAIVVLVLFVCTLIMTLLSRTGIGRRVIRSLINSFKPTRKISIMMATGKFVASISLILSSGTDVIDGLERECSCCENEIVRARIRKCLELYGKDEPLDEAIRMSGLISGMDAKLITVAARAGESDVVFTKLSEQYDEKTGNALNRLTTVVETTLVIVLACLVGAVLLAVMLPLVSMISSIGS